MVMLLTMLSYQQRQWSMSSLRSKQMMMAMRTSLRHCRCWPGGSWQDAKASFPSLLRWITVLYPQSARQIPQSHCPCDHFWLLLTCLVPHLCLVTYVLALSQVKLLCCCRCPCSHSCRQLVATLCRMKERPPVMLHQHSKRPGGLGPSRSCFSDLALACACQQGWLLRDNDGVCHPGMLAKAQAAHGLAVGCLSAMQVKKCIMKTVFINLLAQIQLQ